MKKIFARLKNKQHVVVFNDAEIDAVKDIYKIPNTKNSIPFEKDCSKIGEEQWYFVTPTEEQKEEMLGEYVSESGSAMLSVISPDYYKEVNVIYAVSGVEKLFTKITTRHIMQAQKCIAFNEKPTVVEQGNSILLTGEVDAYWNGTQLYFKKFSFVRSLFPGIQKMYKEITEQETNEFLSSPLFELKEEMSSHFISLRNRQKITEIIDGKIIDLKDLEVCEKYLEYAKDYNLDLEINENKIALIDNSDVVKVISLLGESFYTTEIGGEKREIRSSRKLTNAKRKRAK